MKAKKSYGQHFLTNENTAHRIAHFLERKEDIKNVLEIGPGKGMLTKYLMEQNINLSSGSRPGHGELPPNPLP